MKLDPNKTSVLSNFNSLSGPNFSDEAGGIILGLTANKTFPDLDPAITVGRQQLQDYLDAAELAKSRDKSAVQAKAAARRALTATLITWGRYLMLVSGGDRQALTSTNYPLSRRGQEVIPISVPRKVVVEDGLLPQSLRLSSEGVKEAVSYLFQYTDKPVTPATVWETESGTSKAYTFNNLQQGVRYYLRIAAVGSRGQIAYSETVTRIVQ